MTLVIDSSAMAAGLVDSGDAGRWARGLIGRETLLAPHSMPVEVASVLRRLVAAGLLSADQASLAMADLGDLDIGFYSFQSRAERVWELRQNLTAYDAWYIALAEEFDAPLATLDGRLVSAPGPRCRFLTC